MDDLLRLVMMFLAETRAVQRTGVDASRLTTGVLCAGCAMVCIIAGVACGVAALWIFLAPRIGEAGAALTAAGIFLVMSGSLMFAARNMFRPAPGQVAKAAAEPITDEIAGMLRQGFERHKGASLLAALVAGMAAGNQK